MNTTKQFNVSANTITKSDKKIKELEKIKSDTQKTFTHTYNEYIKIKYSCGLDNKKSLTLVF